jgi:hypothetical protein
MSSRLRELERIDHENLKMINLLIKTKPGVQSARDMEREYNDLRRHIKPKRFN